MSIIKKSLFILVFIPLSLVLFVTGIVAWVHEEFDKKCCQYEEWTFK